MREDEKMYLIWQELRFRNGRNGRAVAISWLEMAASLEPSESNEDQPANECVWRWKFGQTVSRNDHEEEATLFCIALTENATGCSLKSLCFFCLRLAVIYDKFRFWNQVVI